MTGFKLAYDYYLRSKLETKKQAARFRSKRSKLSYQLQEVVLPQLDRHGSLVSRFEMERIIMSLRRGYARTVNRGLLWTHLESATSDRHEEFLSRREVSSFYRMFLVDCPSKTF